MVQGGRAFFLFRPFSGRGEEGFSETTDLLDEEGQGEDDDGDDEVAEVGRGGRHCI